MWKKIVQDQQLEKTIIEKINELANTIGSPAWYKNDGALIGHSGGSILLYSYLNRFMNTDKYNTQIETNLSAALQQPNRAYPLAYSTGILGMFYLVDHLRIHQFIDVEEMGTGLEKTSLQQHINSGYFDFLHGTGGMINYLLQDPHQKNHDLIQNWVQVLENLGQADEQTIKWEIQFGSKPEEFGQCLGLAHGIPNLIILLAKISAVYGIDTRPLMTKACNNLLSLQNVPGEQSMFPQSVISGVKKNPARLAWCYGDLGCALALYFAGQSLQHKPYLEAANDIFVFNTHRRDLERNRINDGAFCHGSVGVAHIYARMYNYTGDERFRETAEFWYRTTLNYACHTDGVCGFKSFSAHQQQLENDLTLLEGASGIGLSLISAVSDVEPKWDTCFLLS